MSAKPFRDMHIWYMCRTSAIFNWTMKWNFMHTTWSHLGFVINQQFKISCIKWISSLCIHIWIAFFLDNKIVQWNISFLCYHTFLTCPYILYSYMNLHLHLENSFKFHLFLLSLCFYSMVYYFSFIEEYEGDTENFSRILSWDYFENCWYDDRTGLFLVNTVCRLMELQLWWLVNKFIER